MRPPKAPDATKPAERRLRGFEPAAGLLKDRLRAPAEKRGFAVARLLTQWDEIAGPRLAGVTRPVKVGFGREGLGATLTLLVAPAHGPQVQMELPALIERVNGAYGYRAIARITLTQTAETGFAEGQTPFQPATKRKAEPDPVKLAETRGHLDGIGDPDLKAALETLARNILTRTRSKEGFKP